MVSNVTEPTCVYCRNCVKRGFSYKCFVWGDTRYLSPHRARACKYFEFPGAPCRTMKKARE